MAPHAIWPVPFPFAVGRAGVLLAAGQVNGSGGVRRVIDGYVRIADALDSQNRHASNGRVAEQTVSSRARRIWNRGTVDERAGAARIACVAVERASRGSQYVRGIYKRDAEPEITCVRWRAREGDRSRGAGGWIDDRVTVVACYGRRAVVAGGDSGSAAAAGDGEIVSEPRSRETAVAGVGDGRG